MNRLEFEQQVVEDTTRALIGTNLWGAVFTTALPIGAEEQEKIVRAALNNKEQTENILKHCLPLLANNKDKMLSPSITRAYFNYVCNYLKQRLTQDFVKDKLAPLPSRYNFKQLIEKNYSNILTCRQTTINYRIYELLGSAMAIKQTLEAKTGLSIDVAVIPPSQPDLIFREKIWATKDGLWMVIQLNPIVLITVNEIKGGDVNGK